MEPTKIPAGFARFGYRQDICALCSYPPNGPMKYLGQWGWMHSSCASQWEQTVNPKAGAFPLWAFILIPIIGIPLVIVGALAPPKPSTPSVSSPTSGAYIGQITSYMKAGQRWRVIQIKPGASKSEILDVARRVVDKDSEAYFALVDDASQAYEYAAWSEHGGDPRHPFPQAWVEAHLIGLVMHKLGRPGMVFENSKPPFDVTPL